MKLIEILKIPSKKVIPDYLNIYSQEYRVMKAINDTIDDIIAMNQEEIDLDAITEIVPKRRKV